MPELAEVEFYRKQWNCGVGKKIVAVHVNAKKRIFRGIDPELFKETLSGATLLESRAHGKQMLFRFSKNGWIGIHLGMTGKLRAEAANFSPGKHDHLVLFQSKQALVFSDPRLFGRVQFHAGPNEPAWWTKLAPGLLSEEFTLAELQKFLQRRRKAPIKAVLLMQERFPGVGNWMADEILWRAKIHPKTPAGELDEQESAAFFREIRFVCREALRIIGKDFSDPPKSWLFLHRWEKGGNCPRCQTPLRHATIGGRTTCWCPKCQGTGK